MIDLERLNELLGAQRVTLNAERSEMTAAVLERYGDPVRVRRVRRPSAGPGQVLVRIHASGVNPLDVRIQAGAAEHARQLAEVGTVAPELDSRRFTLETIGEAWRILGAREARGKLVVDVAEAR